MRDHPFPTTNTGCVITSTGIVIGGAVDKRKACMRSSADIVAQACMLPPPRRPSVRDQLVELIYTAPLPILLSIAIGGIAIGVAKVLSH